MGQGHSADRMHATLRIVVVLSSAVRVLRFKGYLLHLAAGEFSEETRRDILVCPMKVTIPTYSNYVQLHSTLKRLSEFNSRNVKTKSCNC